MHTYTLNAYLYIVWLSIYWYTPMAYNEVATMTTKEQITNLHSMATERLNDTGMLNGLEKPENVRR